MTTTATTTSAAGATRSLPRVGATAAGTALIANLALFAVGSVAGVDFAIRPAGGTAMTVTAASVAIVTVVALTVGTALAGILGRLSRPFPLVVAVGAVATLLSLGGPLAADAATDTTVLLAAMHLATGAAYLWFVGRPVARRR